MISLKGLSGKFGTRIKDEFLKWISELLGAKTSSLFL